MDTIKAVIFTIEEIERLNEDGYLVDSQLLDDDGEYPDGNCVIVPVSDFTNNEINSLDLERRIEDLYYRDDYTSEYSDLDYSGKWYAKCCTGEIFFELESDSEKIDRRVLSAMENLVKEGESLCSGNEGDFSEFAEVNNFNIKTVQEVCNTYDEYLNALFLFNNKEVELDEIANFLDVSVDEYRDEILESESLDNGLVNICFKFVKKNDPLCENIVRVNSIEKL